MKKQQATESERRPVLLGIIQVLNYTACLLTAFTGLVYLISPETIASEANSSNTAINLTVAGLHFAVAGLIGYVAYLFRKRSVQAVRYFIIFNFLSYGLLAVINHFDPYDPPLYEELLTYGSQSAMAAYLLFSRQVAAYFNH